MRVLIDFRMQHAGVARYGRDLITAMHSLPDGPELLVIYRGVRGFRRLLTKPFTPWGRRLVLRTAVSSGREIIHGLHFEVPRSPTIPTVVTIPDLIPLQFPASLPNPVRRRAFQRMTTAAMSSAERVITHSGLTADALIKHGANSDKIVVIPHGVGPHFSPVGEVEREEAMRRFGGGRPYVAAALRDRPHKNVEGLEAAAALLSEKHDIRVAASGWLDKKPPRHLSFVGFLGEPDFRLFLAGAEALILPSFIEGFGLPALESLACGTPVVCGDGVGVLEYIRPGTIVVDVARPDEMADALIAVASDKGFRQELANQGLAAISSLTVGAEAAATVSVYRELAG